MQCECGCGSIVNFGKRFIYGHNFRVISEASEKKRIKSLTGRKHSEETKRKISKGGKGKIRSQETRQRISEGKRGKKISPMAEETKRKISLANSGENHPMFGKGHTEEAKRKISIAKTGIPNLANRKPKSLEARRKISSTLKNLYKSRNGTLYGIFGSDHPAWKGGAVIKVYPSEFYNSELKNFIKSRDNNKCQNSDCWRTCNHLPLNIHHIDYDVNNNDYNNLILLCFSCNSRANFKREYWTKFYQNIINNKERGKCLSLATPSRKLSIV